MDILISACLLGLPCRYDGAGKRWEGAAALRSAGHHLVPVCPEQLGGLPTPRPPAERMREGVFTRAGEALSAFLQREQLKAIVAADRRWGIGKDGDQLCYIPADLKRFKALTTGHAVILGRRTLATFPGGRPLPGRRNLILSRDPDFSPQGVEVFRSLEALRAAAPEDAFVIGGGAVYAQLLPWCDTAYVTRLERTFPADTYFPDLDADPAWRLTETEGPYEHQGLVFRYDTYRRI